MIAEKWELMIINRVWAMPNKWTFKIKPIAELLERYVGNGKGWIDPFAGMCSPAEITNDINPEAKTTYHLDALDFLKQLNSNQYKGVLFDPPYSHRQVKECYENIGRDFTLQDSQDVGRYTVLKKECSNHLIESGYALSFGWNSHGIGKQNGFEIIEILLVCHGSAHNDTIVTVERKITAFLL